MQASQGARSSSTHMAARRHMVAARSPAKIRPRLTAPPLMPRATSRRTLLRLAWLNAAQSSYLMRLVCPSHLSIYCDTFGTGQVHETAIEKAIEQCMDLTPRGIREHLQMNRPIYERTAAYGHFGREPDADGGFSWEKTDLAKRLKRQSKSLFKTQKKCPAAPSSRAFLYFKTT